MTHTPGPWTMFRNSAGHANFVGVSTHAVCQITFADSPTGEANARLIAAAPELLEALERIVKETATSHVTKAAKAAIAKARGVTE